MVWRMLALLITRDSTGLTYKEIGKLYNIYSGATVRKYCERLRMRCKTQADILKMYEKIMKKCHHVTT